LRLIVVRPFHAASIRRLPVEAKAHARLPACRAADKLVYPSFKECAPTMPLPKTPALTTDCVVIDGRGRVLLVRRKNPPFRGAYALPGGFVDIGETVENACRRELREETGVTARRLRLIGVYSNPARDPRGHTCSVAFLARVPRARAAAGDDAAAADWVQDWRKCDLAFDHRQILSDVQKLLRKG
jgi:8-oxo-dGTP diphosphatase